MTKAPMIRALQYALRELITRELKPIINGLEIKFVCPDNDFSESITSPTVNIFLYDIRENLEIRTHKNIYYMQSPQTRNTDSPYSEVISVTSPVYINFSYIITAWSQDSRDIEGEADILSRLLEKLLIYPHLDRELLSGTELEGIKPLPQIRILHAHHLQSIGEFWNAIGKKIKPIIHCTITVAVTPKSCKDPIPQVTHSIIKVKNIGRQEIPAQKEARAIIGNVVFPAGIEIEPVNIKVKRGEEVISELTSNNGYFCILNLEDDNYLLSAENSERNFSSPEIKVSVQSGKSGLDPQFIILGLRKKE